MINPSSLLARLRRSYRDLRRLAPHAKSLLGLSEVERRYLTAEYDDRTPLPPDADTELTRDNPRLHDLRRRYAALNLPVCRHVQWGESLLEHVNRNLSYFRGDSPYVWNYREMPRVTRLKYFVFLNYVSGKDNRGLLSQLEEDGAFGCWHFEYPGYPTVSRDLLDSINEISFLDREFGLFERTGLRVLDIGAGYGRLAHRMLSALPQVVDYCCVDAIPESTFLCDYYLNYRNLMPPARVVPLDQIDSRLQSGGFDLALNIHSFSECSLEAVSWWIDKLARLEVPALMIVPNDPTDLLTTEADGDKRDFRPLLEDAGYRLSHREPVFRDQAVQELIGIRDHFFLFKR